MEGGGVSRGRCSACNSLRLHCISSSTVGWLYVLMGQLELPACLQHPSGGCGKLEEQVSILPDRYAAVEVVMGLSGWVLQPFLSQPELPCTCRIASCELSPFP